MTAGTDSTDSANGTPNGTPNGTDDVAAGAVPGTASGEALPKDRLGTPYWRLWIATVSSNFGDGVGFIAYPWLASAVTRDPFLIALVGVTGSLPWLLFSLPAGAIIDRVDRKRLVVGMDLIRGLLTAVAAVAVLIYSGDLPSPQELTAGVQVTTNWPLYSIFIVTALLLGFAQVLRDNAATSLLPSIVRKDQLEKANGRMWSAEMVVGSLVGPPVGSFLIGIAFFLPIVVDATSFFVAAALVMLVPGLFHPKADPALAGQPRQAWYLDVRDGITWLRRHELLWPMAMILAVLNLTGAFGMATLILFMQEVLDTTPFEFALVMTGGAVGGALGGLVASNVAKRMGAGSAVQMLLWIMPVTSIAVGLASHWVIAWLSFAAGMLLAIIWNTITVSMRQRIIPDHLLGRVNSAYRFLVLGAAPVGTAIGGGIVAVLDGVDRVWALRAPWLLSGLLGWALAAVGHRYLTNERIAAAEAEAAALESPAQTG